MMFKIKDDIHGEIVLPNYIQEVITTKEFERLRNIRQLGVSFYHFENANHTRYDHSIGTAYLCIKILDILERNSDIKIDDNHKKCVVLAGLLHDLGHGPFSHLWENVVREGNHKNWSHEDQSVAMIHHMIENNKISLHPETSIHDDMVELTCSLITGDQKTWNRLLKPSEMFLTEIVSNKYCKLDVDKLDYMSRDFKFVNRDILPFQGILDRVRIVFDDNNVSHIGYHVNDFELIENVFINRANYHMDVYQLNEVVGIEKQFMDACFLADNGGFKLLNYSITDIQQDCAKYCHLDDNLLDLIRKDNNPSIKEAQELINNLDKGKFYDLIYESKDVTEVNNVYEKLVGKFGKIFCIVEKFIPYASVPSNIPLYNDDGDLVPKTSDHKLEYASKLIFCKAFDPIIVQNACNLLNNNEA
ncbi:deoxynucleoside triphosphate triphosphohydrolase SAMHD1 homolog [Chironomus tepperi]|uniref:deoxynucleoside triphosphate triphosphohydrolase SAMHD1 homolog n=1 Tax=Chironomus tepperi TaxID=113505 RepID=UPI00391F50DB